jgi:hypothetical protein
MLGKAVFIVIDSGFSRESISGLTKVIGTGNLDDALFTVGAPFVDAEELNLFAGDPMKHGSIVLERLRELDPDAPFVLIKAYGPDLRLIRTGWADGRQMSPGWTEAYLWAVELCRRVGLPSVANCSFGGFTHASDGTGWESFQLGHATGPGRSGHVVVAAAGPGDGRAVHASWMTAAGDSTTVEVYQAETSQYNLWSALPGVDGWTLEVRKDGQAVGYFQGAAIPVNFWNNRQQLMFTVHGSGHFQFVLRREGTAGVANRFDCWVVGGAGAAFLNYVDPTLIAEPAIFPHVLSVGLRHGKYAPDQALPGGKPDVLLDGTGAISFRLPEVTALVARLLSVNPGLDVEAVRALIGK